MTEPAVSGANGMERDRGVGVEVHGGAASGVEEADPAALKELEALLLELRRINVEGIPPVTPFDPSWPETDGT